MIKICDTCHKEFISKSSRNRFCSKICCNVTTKLEVIQKQQITVFKIFERDNFRCIYCGKSSIEDGVKLHIDHVYPISKHGDNNLNNLVTSCEYCNLSK